MKKSQKPVAVAHGIHWVGALNPELQKFDVVMKTEFGTSYNAYLVQGTEKTALIETVKDGFIEESLALIGQLIDPAKIDYLILQHTEPDHSGSIAAMSAAAPNAKIYCTRAASMNLPFIAGRQLPIEPVKEGDVLELGGRTLRFIMAPFLHWPDTMFTYDDQTGVLFTCDAFGCHYAPEHVLESKTDPAFKGARRYYYDCIVSPFAASVTKAIAHLTELQLPKISVICPSHGPVLDEEPMEAVRLYGEWAAERKRGDGKTAFIGYVSCYGYTMQLAERLRTAFLGAGWKVNIADLSDISAERAAEQIYAADCIAIGSPTVNADALPPIWTALAHVAVPLTRGKKAIAFGSYGWSGEAVPSVELRLTQLGMNVLGSYKVRFRPTEESAQKMQELVALITA
ncbi:MAG: FprA family A-type flavoprotein [Clostridia bacterium]